jgi:hypothetical protein
VRLRDLPLSLAKAFGDDALSLEHFVAPRDNPCLGVQFVTKDGAPTHPTSQSETVYFDEPLSGPFYNLPLSGIAFTDPLAGSRYKWKNVIAISESADGTVSSSALFQVKVSIGKMKDFVASNGIKWYLLNAETWKWTSFDDYSDYRKAAREAVEPNSVT